MGGYGIQHSRLHDGLVVGPRSVSNAIHFGSDVSYEIKRVRCDANGRNGSEAATSANTEISLIRTV